MRTSLLIFALTTMIIIGTNGQSDIEVKTTFHDYFTTVMQQENEKTLDYIYPKLFDLIPKDRMLEMMNKTKADTTTRVSLVSPSVTRISEVTKVGGTDYVLIQYTFQMTMTFTLAKNEDGEEETEPFDFTAEVLKEKYGKKNVTEDRENNTLKANVSNEMFAIRDPAYTGWKFLEKKENMQPILSKLLPKEVLKMK